MVLRKRSSEIRPQYNQSGGGWSTRGTRYGVSDYLCQQRCLVGEGLYKALTYLKSVTKKPTSGTAPQGLQICKADGFPPPERWSYFEWSRTLAGASAL